MIICADPSPRARICRAHFSQKVEFCAASTKREAPKAGIGVNAAKVNFVRVLIVGIHRSERPVWNSPKSVALNDRFDDTGCTAATNLPHLQGNAASAKVENLMSVLSAQQP